MKLFGKILLGIFGSAIILIVGSVTIFYFIFSNNPFNDRDFDQKDWLSMHQDWDPDNPRGKMYEDLVENYLRKGMTKAQVVALLGESDLVTKPEIISYNLGMWSGMRIDYDSLDLVFSNDGKLTKYYRVQH